MIYILSNLCVSAVYFVLVVVALRSKEYIAGSIFAVVGLLPIFCMIQHGL